MQSSAARSGGAASRGDWVDPSGGSGDELIASDPILVVDDEESIRTLVRIVLSAAGFTVLEACDGTEALQVLSRHEVSAVFLDCMMPGTPWTEVLRSIRTRPTTAVLPVILLTAMADAADRVKGLEAGASDYLTKPFLPDELVARLRAHLRGQRAWAHFIERRLRDRAEMTRTLGQITPGPSAEQTAGVICTELLRLHEVGGSAILAFTGEAAGVALACEGNCGALRTGAWIPQAVAADLQQRAAQGPWLAENGSPADLYFWSWDTPQRATAFVPMRSGRDVLGLLALSIDPRTPTGPVDHVAQALSAGIDFAGIAAALLAPGLTQVNEREGVRNTLRRMLTEGGHRAVFQPIVELGSGRVVGYEALTRFRDGVTPERRFAEASRVGMGHELERVTLAGAIEAGRRLPDDCWLSVNVSVPALIEGTAVIDLTRADRPVVLEITEHDRVEDYGLLRGALDSLPDGVRLSVDDAGAGYSCLGHILQLQPDFVKIDRSWVTGIESDAARQALVVGLGYFAKETGSQLVAEGVETEPEMVMLRRLGAEFAQGYYLGRPEPITA